MVRLKINPENLDFDLPEELIAQEPLEKRDDARLLVMDRQTGMVREKKFTDLESLLKKGDVLVLNEAKVNPVKLRAKKKTGGKVEVILVSEENNNVWTALLRPLLKPGTIFVFEDGTEATLIEKMPRGENRIQFKNSNVGEVIKSYGHLPLPPYIKRPEGDPRIKRDAIDYQTVYSAKKGSLAAPTAGLHFTRMLLDKLKANGVVILKLVLHVGWGTFRPIAHRLDQHEMMAESYECSKAFLAELIKAKNEKRRIVAVGTTTTRVMESLPDDIEPNDLKSQTNLFITPGFKFRWLSGLITNFHVPRSTPLSLTAAFAGFDHLEQAYDHAIREKFRFFSYGDAMLIL